MDWKRKKTIVPRCDCSIHDVISGIVEYLIITPIFAIGYLAIPCITIKPSSETTPSESVDFTFTV